MKRVSQVTTCLTLFLNETNKVTMIPHISPLWASPPGASILAVNSGILCDVTTKALVLYNQEEIL